MLSRRLFFYRLTPTAARMPGLPAGGLGSGARCTGVGAALGALGIALPTGALGAMGVGAGIDGAIRWPTGARVGAGVQVVRGAGAGREGALWPTGARVGAGVQEVLGGVLYPLRGYTSTFLRQRGQTLWYQGLRL